MFSHLHGHSEFSIADGLHSPKKWTEALKEMGAKAHALTDHGSMAGCVSFYKAMKEAKLQPILGCEVYFVGDPLVHTTEAEKPSHLVLLAKTYEGWLNLLKLQRLGYTEGFYYRPRIGWDWLVKYHEGLICTTACLGGVIGSQIIAEKPDLKKAGKNFRALRHIFGEDLYVEYQGHNADLQRNVNKYLQRINHKSIITNDCHYISACHHKVQQLVKQDAYRNVEKAMSHNEFDRLYLASPTEIYEWFRKDHPYLTKRFVVDAMRNTEEIVEKCKDFALPEGKRYLPVYNAEKMSSAEFFKKLATKSLSEFLREGKVDKRVYVERFAKEFKVISKYKLQDYFLIVWDIVQFAKSKGIYVGLGRGSAAGSLISYLLGIVKIDPIPYKLLFERFLNANRCENGELPDIDLDFESARRNEVKEYIFQKYGRESVCEIGSYGRLKLKSSIIGFGKAFHISHFELLQITTKLDLDKDDAQNLDAAMDESPALKKIMKHNPDLDFAVREVNGQIKSQSIHPAGLVISSEPIHNIIPIKSQALKDPERVKKEGKRVIVTQCEDKDVISSGLIKMDLLGIKEYDIFKYVVENSDCDFTVDDYVEKIHERELNEPDQEVWKYFKEGRGEGIFQFSCLSGDTVVNVKTMQTIKDLHDRKLKKFGSNQITSVLIDDGLWRRNRVKAVKYCGKKDTYKVITKDRRFIRATLDHKFLTESGWKDLKELKVGDKVGFRDNWGPNDGLRVCKRCGVEKRSGADFCYKCSAEIYQNPKHNKEGLRKTKGVNCNWCAGGVPAEKLKVMNDKRALTLKKKIENGWINPLKGKKRPEITGRNNPMFGRVTKSKLGFRKDLGHFVRSSWEADFARILKHYKIDYDYEPETFDLGECTYTPDFLIKESGVFVEIKGWMTEKSKMKINLFREKFPEKELIVINKTSFAELSLKYKNLINWECPKYPDDFVWEEVESIELYGMEDTYDICMENSAKNYLANGFVVHNSDGMKELLKMMETDCLADLIAAVALYRPGCLANGWHYKYCNRKAGTETVAYPHPDVEMVLSDTYGVPVYQEQIMEMFHVIGDIPLNDADTIRSALGKKDEKKLKKFRGQFIRGATKKLGSVERGEELWNQLKASAGYNFNRSHAAVYALVAYISQYFKVHHSAEFWAAVLGWDAKKGKWDALATNKRAALEMGVTICLPDINKSKISCTGATEYTDDMLGVIADRKVLWSLCGVKSVGIKTAEEIISKQPYSDLEDFYTRVHKSKVKFNCMIALAHSGAFDCFGDRREILKELHELKKEKCPKLTDDVMIFKFYDYMGFFEEKLKKLYAFSKMLLTESDLRDMNAKELVAVGGMISDYKVIKTRKGEKMGKINLVDLDESIELTFFPETWARYSTYINKGVLIQVMGYKSNYGGKENLVNVEEIEVIG